MSQVSLAPTRPRRSGSATRTALPTAPRRSASTRPSSPGKGRVTTVVAPPQTRAVGIGFLTICLLALIGGLVGLLLLNTQRAQQSFTLDRLQARSVSLAATQDSLDSQLDTLSAPQQLALQAQAQGMVPATSVRFVDSKGKTLGVAKGSAAANRFTVGTLPTTPASKVAALAANAAAAGVQLPPAAPAATPLASVPPAVPSTPKATSTATPKATPSATAKPRAGVRPPPAPGPPPPRPSEDARQRPAQPAPEQKVIREPVPATAQQHPPRR